MDLLDSLINLFAHNGYLAVFLALMVCGTGAPLPEDITLVAGGVIAGLGHANVHVMLAVAMFGVLLGDSGMFLMGRHFGDRILQWRLVAWLLPPARYAKVQCQFERYGNRLMFFARFLPGMRTAVYITAGTMRRISFRRFILLDGVAACLSVPFWVYLGFIGADNHEWLVTWLRRGQGSLWVLAGLLAVTLLIMYWWRRRCRTRRGPCDGL